VTETLETPKEELTTGSTFAGRYQIIEELGTGGMGKVYKIVDKKIKEKVALKLLKPEISTDKKTIERFSNELKLARKISHRNICRMYDLGEEEGNHYITMEYVPGEDLKSTIIRVGQLSVAKTLFIAKQVCDGLAEAHKLGVVHRDLKPQNVMVDEEGNARIMDFGIARSLKTKGITAAGVMIGTPEYMSPEQVEGKEVDQRSDIYSLGVVIYEMVTGQVPFEGDTPFTIGMKHKGEEPKDPKELNAQIPEDLSRLILRCMEKDREKRYQSAGEVRSDLTNIEKELPTTDRAIPKKKPITSREITVTFGLKRIFMPALVVVALAIIALIVWKFLLKKEPVSAPASKPSIAILPFEDLSPQKDQEYLCDGFAESLINALTKIRELRVPARTSSFSFKGKERDIHEIGERLNVNTVLEGSVQKAENRLRVTVKLINVSDESLLWSEQYNRELDDVFAIQDEITFAIVDKLKVNLLGKERGSLAKRYTENQEAYNLYLKGRYFWNKRTEEDLKKALESFEKAVELDPNFSMAYVGMADTYVVLPTYSDIPEKEAYPKAEAAALKALELDNNLAEAYAPLAGVKADYDWDWKGAVKEFKRAIELNPRYSIAHLWLSETFMEMGRHEEAIEEIKRALELDPLSLVANRAVGGTYFHARQYDKAMEALKKMIELDPTFSGTHSTLGRVYLQKEMYDEALAEFQNELDLRNGRDPSTESMIGIAYMKMGKRDKAQKVTEDLLGRAREEHVSPYILGRFFIAIGENDRGFEYLEKAYQERDNWLRRIKIDPFFDSVRSDPRHKALLKKVGLE
jgi:serine/threonine-protein kinase